MYRIPTTIYGDELKKQVVKECTETNNYSAVSRKHDIPTSTIFGWIKKHKNVEKNQNKKKSKSIESELNDLKLENQILKELLKKSHQLWLKD